MSALTLCNGAFVATLVKGEKGQQSWQYTPTFKKQKYKGHEKEKPQFSFISKQEEDMKKIFQGSLKNLVLQTTKYLKSL